MKKHSALLITSILLLTSCQNEKKVLSYNLGPFGFNEKDDYIPCLIEDNEIIKTPKVIYPFNTMVLFKSYILDSEKNEYTKLIDDASAYLKRLSVCFDRHNLYVNKNNELVKNLAYLNMNYGVDSYVELEKETYELLKIGYDLTRLTDGKFNIFIGELSSLWDEYIKEGKEKPSEEEINNARFTQEEFYRIDTILQFDDSNNSVKFNKFYDKKLSITFGGIAKGRATDLLNNMLKDKRILISAGQSSIATYGYTFHDSWALGIKNPMSANYTDDSYLLFEKQGIFSFSTSGDYQSYRIDEEGNRYHHIIDCFTGYPSSYYRSVSLYGDSGVYADGLTTALMLSDFQEANMLLDKIKEQKRYEFLPIFMEEENGKIVAKVNGELSDFVSINDNSDMDLIFF